MVHQNNSIVDRSQPHSIEYQLLSKNNNRHSKGEEDLFNAAEGKPFETTIDALREIPKIESPMMKLEYIY